MARLASIGLALLALAWAGCGAVPVTPPTAKSPAAETGIDRVSTVEAANPAPMAEAASRRPGTRLARTGEEIMVAGQLFHVGTPVVLWTDEGGYDGYRVERRFTPWGEADWSQSRAANPQLSTPNRYGVREAVLTPAQIDQVRGGGWSLALLQEVVDQFVLHYDASGTSRSCFERLHDDRGLSIHFMLDVDGTIYQTLDLKERAWHATVANSRSIGIEIANIGAYPDPAAPLLRKWYSVSDDNGAELRIPREAFPESLRNPAAARRPDRPTMISGEIHGEVFHQYDLTAAQYDALAQLTAALCTIFPKMACEVPRDEAGAVLTTTMPVEAWRDFGGVLGHFHIQRNKVDPGPALQWERLLREARAWMEPRPESPPVPAETPASP